MQTTKNPVKATIKADKIAGRATRVFERAAVRLEKAALVHQEAMRALDEQADVRRAAAHEAYESELAQAEALNDLADANHNAQIKALKKAQHIRQLTEI